MTDGKIENVEFDWKAFGDEISAIFVRTEVKTLDKREIAEKLGDFLYEQIKCNPDICHEIIAKFNEVALTVGTNVSDHKTRGLVAGFLLPVVGGVLGRIVRGSKNVPAEGGDQPIKDARKWTGEAVENMGGNNDEGLGD